MTTRITRSSSSAISSKDFDFNSCSSEGSYITLRSENMMYVNKMPVVVLGAMSPYLKSIFESVQDTLQSCQQLILPQFSNEALDKLIQFISTRQIKSSLKCCSKILELLHVLGVDTSNIGLTEDYGNKEYKELPHRSLRSGRQLAENHQEDKEGNNVQIDQFGNVISQLRETGEDLSIKQEVDNYGGPLMLCDTQLEKSTSINQSVSQVSHLEGGVNEISPGGNDLDKLRSRVNETSTPVPIHNKDFYVVQSRLLESENSNESEDISRSGLKRRSFSRFDDKTVREKLDMDRHGERQVSRVNYKIANCFKCGEQSKVYRKKGLVICNMCGPICMTCGDDGHFGKKCPAKMVKVKKCYNCNNEGHLSKHCHRTRVMREGGQSHGLKSNVICYKCGGEGHSQRQCRIDGNLKCFNCQEVGHMARDCTQSWDYESL